MSLAFNVHGEPFEVPATATMWRVRRVKPKGAPEVVYGRDGAPLLLGIGADVEDLKRENVEPGRYRLDAVDDNQRPVLDVAPAYVLLHGETKATSRAAADRDQVLLEALRLTSEAMRAQTELARVVVEKFPAMMESAAVLLRAADGAGLPARQPIAIPVPDQDDEDDDDQEPPPPPPAPPGPDLATVIAQALPMVMATFASKNAAPPAAPERAAVADSPAALSHFRAIQQELTPPERRLSQALVEELAPEDRRSWLGELATLTLPAAVERVKALLHSEPAKPPASKAPAPEVPTVPGGSAQPTRPAMPTVPPAVPTAPPTVPTTPPALSAVPPAAMAHLFAIQQALTPQERALAQALVEELAPDDLLAWLTELSAMPLPVAIERVKALLHSEPPQAAPPKGPGTPGGAS